MVGRIGQMRERVKIQAESETADGMGGYALAWSDVATVWGRVRPLSMRERVNADALQSEVTHEVTIRHYTGLTAKHRFLWGSIPLQIEGIINDDERGRYMVCQVVEGVAT